MMDPQDSDEDQQCLNLELFVAINYGRKRKTVTEDEIIQRVKESLCNGADINAANHNDAGNTALHVAVRRHFGQVIQFLIDHGAKVHIENSQGLTPLTLAQKLKCEQEIIDFLEGYAKSTTNTLMINYLSNSQAIWSKLRNNSEIAVLEVNSVELSPDFLQQVEFYDAIDTAGNLFFVDVIVSDKANIDEDFIKSQLNRLNKLVIIQCGSVTNTKVYCKDSNDDVIVINLYSFVENDDEDSVAEKLSWEDEFGVGLIVKALKLNVVGSFEGERRSLLRVRFDLEKQFDSLRLIDCAIRYGDVITVRLLSLSNWNLTKRNDMGSTTLSVAAEYGNMEKLAAVLRVKFPLPLVNIDFPSQYYSQMDNLLKMAVKAGNCDVVSFMIRCGVKLENEIIDLAWDKKQYNIVLVLLKADCVFPRGFYLDDIDVNDVILKEVRILVEERDHLHILIEQGNLDSLKEFVKSIAPSKLYLNKDNETALFRACKCNKREILMWLKYNLKVAFRDSSERDECVGVLDSANDVLVACSEPVENAHILYLVSKSRMLQHKADFKEYIENIYMELNNIPHISTVLKVIQFCDQLDIIYDFDSDSITCAENVKGQCDFKLGRIFINASADKTELLGTIAHELTHLAMQIVYDNDCNPYKVDDANKGQFDTIVEEIEKTSPSVDIIIKRVFSPYKGNEWPSELIVRVNHMLATYGSEKGLQILERQAKSLLEYYQGHVTSCCANFVSETHLIKPRNIIKVLNDYAGIMCRMDKSKITLKEHLNVRELCESEVQFAVVTSTSPFLSTMSVYQSLNDISQDPNSFIIMNFESYVKRRSEINNAFYFDVCKFLVVLCESVADENALTDSLKELDKLFKERPDKKVIFIMESSKLFEEKIEHMKPKFTLMVFPDVEYTLDDVRVESAQLLLDQSVSLQCRDANIKLSSLIDEEHYKLVDPQTLLKLINKQPIVIGKGISTSSHYDENFYIDRYFIRQALIKEEILRDEDQLTMYAISGIDETTLGNLVKRRDLVCRYDQVDKGHVVKYTIIDGNNCSEQYQQLCQMFPRHTIHRLEKVDGGFRLLESSGIAGLKLSKVLEHGLAFCHYSEDQLVNQSDENRVIVVSDTAGMGKTTILNSILHRLIEKCPHLWVIRINLNDYTKILDLGQEIKSFKMDQPSRALSFFVDRLLGSRVESRLETEFEKNLLLHFLQANEDRVVTMFDGFDEIKETHQEVVINLLAALKSSKVKQLWVTTRPHMREALENTLHQLAYTLQPFSKTDKTNFLTSFWRHSLNIESEIASRCHLILALVKLESFAEALIELLFKSICDEEKSFAEPLQLRMLAECFEQTVKEFCFSHQTLPNLPQKLQLNALYGNLFTIKYEIFQTEKNKLDFSKPNVEAQSDVQKESFIKNHRIASLFRNFDDRQRGILLTSEELKCGVSFINDISCKKLNTGIIDCIIEGRPRFVHSTFAEYLTAEFIMNLLAKEQQSIKRIKLIVEVFYEVNFRYVRTFIDSYFYEKSVIDAVLNKHGRALNSLWYEKPEVFKKMDLNPFFPYRLDICRALNIAASEGNANLANFLLKCFGNQNIRAKLLKSICCDNNDGMQLLQTASKHGNFDVVKVLVEHGADVNARVNKNGRYCGFTPLLLAAYNGYANICEWLISNGADINAIVSRKESPFQSFNALHLAATRGHLNVVMIMRNCEEIDFNVVVKSYYHYEPINALHIAALNGHWDMVKWIISEGVIDGSPALSYETYGERSVLCLAFKSGPPEVVQWLIDLQTDVNSGPNLDEMGALHLAASGSNLEVVKMLVSKGVNVNAVNSEGQTPLHRAARFKCEQVIEFLLEVEDIDVNSVDKNHNTPLHLASSNLKIFQMLVSKGANVHAVSCDGQTPLHLAASQNADQVIEWLFNDKDIDVNVVDNYGETPLHKAASNNKPRTVEMLVSNGADVNAVNCQGHTPLHVADRWGCGLVVECLLRLRDVDVNAIDWNLERPLTPRPGFHEQNDDVKSSTLDRYHISCIP